MEQPFTIASVSGTNNWPSRESFRPKEHERNEEVDHGGDGGGKSLPVRKSHEDKRYHRRLLLRGRNFGANDVCERDTTAVFTSPAETFDHFHLLDFYDQTDARQAKWRAVTKDPKDCLQPSGSMDSQLPLNALLPMAQQSLWHNRSNEDISCCIPSNSLLTSRTCGPGDRRAFARHTIPAGHVIVRNAPLAFVVHDRDERCAACFQKPTNKKLMRCSQCQQTWYCSRECQVQDFRLHRFECSSSNSRDDNKLFGNDEWQHNARLLLRTVLKILTTKEEECRLENNEDCKTPQQQLCTCSRRHFYQLGFGTQTLDPHEVRTLQTVTQILTSRSKLLTKIGMDYVASDPSLLRPMLVNFLLRFRVNNFGMVDAMARVVGSGVYPLGALLNHSCAPNCVLRYTDHRGILEIVAARDIDEGEELTHSYVELVESTSQRQEHLKSIYEFDCRCSRCRECYVILPLNYKDLSVDKLIDWILDECNPNVETPEPSIDEARDSTIQVPLDDLLLPTSMDAGVVEKAKLLQQQARLAMARDDYLEELSCFSQAQNLLARNDTKRNSFQLFSLELYKIQCEYLSCLILNQEEMEKTVATCRHIVAILCMALSQTPNHPLLGLQLFTLGDLYQANGQVDRAERTYRWALKTLLISQGPNSEMVQMLREKLE